MRTLSLFITLLFTITTLAQCSVSSLGFAFTKEASYDAAVIQAQQMLIEQCGGGVNISSTSLYSISEDEKGKVQDSYNESISLALSGLIQQFKVLSSTFKLLEGGQVKTTLKAVGKVVVPDKSELNMSVSGIDPVYFEGQLMSMDVNSSIANSHIYVFQSVNGKLQLICPNPFQSGLSDDNGLLRIPNERYDLRAIVDNEDSFNEQSTFYFVGSTRNIEYDGDGSIDKLIKWYNSLPSKGRSFAVETLLISRK